MPRLPKGGKEDDGSDAGGGLFEKQVTKRVQPVVAALDRFKPALEANTQEIRELTRALKERR